MHNLKYDISYGIRSGNIGDKDIIQYANYWVGKEYFNTQFIFFL